MLFQKDEQSRKNAKGVMANRPGGMGNFGKTRLSQFPFDSVASGEGDAFIEMDGTSLHPRADANFALLLPASDMFTSRNGRARSATLVAGCTG